MRRRRIAIVCEYSTLNGGERSLLAVLEHVDRSQFDVHILAPPTGPLARELQRLAIAHIPLNLHDGAGRLSRDESLRRLEAACAALQPDLVHANSLSMGRLTGALAQRLSIPCCAHLRDIIALSAAAVADLNRNTQLVAVSHATRDYHVARGIDPDRVQVIYNGVDVDAFRSRPAEGWLRRELGLPADRLIVATIGQICLRKGQDVLAEAAVLNAGLLPHVHYVFVGERYSSKPESVDFEQRIARRFVEAGIADRAHWLGYRDDVARLLNEIDLLAHPARQEPLGRVLLEAGAAGRPIVATNVGGTPEIVCDGASALLVPPGDAPSLAAAIRRLADDPGLRQRLGTAARQRITERFPITESAARLAHFWATPSV
jgi:glycosyltransferase involved in cell wall biosynthesis